MYTVSRLHSQAVYPLMFYYACNCATMQAHSQRSVLSDERLCDTYSILNSECCKCARMGFHCANGMVVALCICAVAQLRREHCSRVKWR